MKKGNLMIWLAGVVIGLIAVGLVLFGNPVNMGFCTACFERDIAGALGFHRAAPVQYLRPEIIGILFGALAASLIAKEFKAEGGSSALTRFILGIFVMIGALVFLGCPLRMMIRLGGGDMNALVGLLGFVAGVVVGVQFLKKGFDLGRTQAQSKTNGLLLPGIMAALLLLLILRPVFNAEAGGPLFFSKEGPAAQHASVLLSLGAGLIVGYLAQKSRLCMAGGVRDVVLMKDWHLAKGSIAILLAVFLGNLIVGLLGIKGVNTPVINLGFASQPIAHSEYLWNFLGLGLVGLASALLGGCPLRQLVLSGAGNTDSALTVLGMIFGAAISHNFMLAASPAGVPIFAKYAVVIAIMLTALIGWTNLERS